MIHRPHAEPAPSSASRASRVAALGALWAVAAGVPAAAQVGNVRAYGHAQGLPQTQVTALHQDRRGYVWVGTYGGLARYDGRAFRTLTTRDGLSANRIADMADVAADGLVVGTVGGGVCFLDGDAIECVRRLDGLAHDVVHDVLVTSDGDVWAATEAGVTWLRARVPLRSYGTGDGLPGEQVFGAAQRPDGSIWVATEGGVARFVNERFEPVAGAPFESPGVIRHTSRGLVLASNAGVFVQRDGSDTWVRLARILDRTLTDVASGPDGTLWIASLGGAARVDADGLARFGVRNGLLSDVVESVLVDREGIVWFGTERGLSKLVPGPLSLWTDEQGLPDPTVRALGQGADGRMWVGTRAGVAVFEDGRFRPIELPAGVTDPRVYALAATPDGGMLVGTRGGLVHYGPGGMRVHGEDDGLPDRYVTSLLADEAGAWVGTAGGVVRWERGAIHRVGVPRLDSVFVVVGAHDAEGRVWFGRRSGGVLVYDHGELRAIGPDEGLTEQTIWSIGRDPNGRMWVGSNGDGVFRVDGDEIVRYTTRDGLVNDFVWQVLPDSRGSVWLFTSNGLDRLVGGDFIHFGPGDGLVDPEGAATAALEDRDGRLWFGVGTGVYSYEPRLARAESRPPPIFIDRLSVGGRGYPTEGARIPPRSGVLSVSYSSPTFRDESSVRFRYRIPEVSAQWSESARENVVSLAGLSPGRYLIEVVAVDGDGVESLEPATAAFQVLPAFWQTWWFRTVGIVLALGGVGFAPFLRARRLEAERFRLESLVHQHTRDLEEKTERLEREVAERQAAQRALADSERRIREIVEHSTNVFYAQTPDRRMTYLSPQIRDLLGVEPEEVKRHFTDFITDHPGNRVGRERTAVALRTGERQPPYELELEAPDGRRIWVEVREAPVVKRGEVVGMVGSLTDMTASKKAADDAQRLQEQLHHAQRMETVGRLAGGVAHDFNNLLTAIISHAQLLREASDAGDLAEGTRDIESAAVRGADLVSQLLAFSRRQIVRQELLDLSTVVHDAAPLLQGLVGDSVVLHLCDARTSAFTRVGRAQLEQILVNLAENAREAMTGGGVLRVAAERVDLVERLIEPGPDEVQPGRYAVLVVSDTGRGMDSATRRRIFEPFFTTKEFGASSGLGLSTVYGIVGQWGGFVHVHSRFGEGTEFRLYLPEAYEGGEA